MTEKTAIIQDKKIFYRVAGKGAPLVLIHGFAEDSDVWRYQVDELSKKYFLIIPDLPGSAQSEMIDDMSMEGMAACVKELLNQELATRQLAGEKSGNGVIMIGHSMGGYITLAFAEKYPETLRAFGLFHSSAFADSSEKKTTRLRSIEFIQTHGSFDFIKQSTPNLFTPEYVNKNGNIVDEMIARYGSFNPEALIAYYRAMILRPARTEILQNFDKPILFIIGKNDKAIPYEDSMKQCHLPQHSFIHILEKAAHMGMWEEQEKSMQALLSFLEDVAV